MSLKPVTISCPVYAPPRTDPPPKGVPAPRASFDAARTGTQNRNHWSAADDLSANASADPEVRRKLRRRARYEVANNPSLNGLVRTIANETIGTGPRLQLALAPEHREAARAVEASFKAWCRAVRLADKLRTMRVARAVDGESFALLTSNSAVAHPVKLDLKLIEADQVETPSLAALIDPNSVSGVEFDAEGNPAWYHVLKQHPGDSGYWNWVGEYDRVAAKFVLHWFTATRPGQARGVSELTSALETVAQLRRWDQATLSSAEFAASVSGLLESTDPTMNGDMGADGGGDAEVANFSEIEYSKNTLMKLPAGMTVKQLEAEQPTAGYSDFKASKLADIGRPLLAPRNVSTGDSSQYNFSSARLDNLPFHRSAWIDRDKLEADLLDRVFLAFASEAALLGLVPASLPPVDEWAWVFNWDSFSSIDPNKEAQAAQLRLELNLTTLAEECAADGKDWVEVLHQRAKEVELAKALGLTPAATKPAAPPTVPAEVPADA
jgi:lambda family phage portal protein